MVLLETFNAAPVASLGHLAELVDGAMAADEPFLRFGLEGGRWMALGAAEVAAAAADVLAEHGVTAARSPGLGSGGSPAAAGACALQV